MDSQELLEALSETIEVELAFDEDGMASFSADGMSVTLRNLPEAGGIVIEGDLGLPPPENLTGLYKTVLESQYLFRDTVGATISIDPSTGRFTLCRVLMTQLLDKTSFIEAVGRFLSTQEVWTKFVQNYREEAPAPAPTETIFGSGFMQV